MRTTAATGLYDVETEDSIRAKISQRMLEASRQANVFDLQKRRTSRTLNSVVGHLRASPRRPVPSRGAQSDSPG